MESEALARLAANKSNPHFALGEIRDRVTNAMIDHRSANNSMAGQISADDNKLQSYIDIRSDMAWHGFEEKRKAGLLRNFSRVQT